MESELGAIAAQARVHGGGCHHCEGTGYRSRTVLAEIVETSPAFMACMRAGDREAAVRHWRGGGGTSLADHARAKVADGLVDPFDAEEQVSWN